MNIHIKRVYDKPSATDGVRVFVDRLWPRGVKIKDAHIDVWPKELAPPTELRRWFHKDRETRYKEFTNRYQRELNQNKTAGQELVREKKTLTLITAVKDVEHSHVPVLKTFLTQL